MNKTGLIQTLTHEEIMSHIKAINRNGDDTRSRLLELHEGESWKVLGYPNWRSMAKAEFPKWSQAYIYFQLRAARTEQGLLDTPDIEPEFSTIVEGLPESYFRELVRLDDPLEQRLALQLTYSAAPKAIPSGKPTAALLQAAVETIQEIKATGKVELDEVIIAAEAKVILRHHERVQEHIDHATNARARKGKKPLETDAVVDYVHPNGRITLFAPSLAKALKAGQKLKVIVYIVEDAP